MPGTESTRGSGFCRRADCAAGTGHNSSCEKSCFFTSIAREQLFLYSLYEPTPQHVRVIIHRVLGGIQQGDRAFARDFADAVRQHGAFRAAVQFPQIAGAKIRIPLHPVCEFFAQLRTRGNSSFSRRIARRRKSLFVSDVSAPIPAYRPSSVRFGVM